MPTSDELLTRCTLFFLALRRAGYRYEDLWAGRAKEFLGMAELLDIYADRLFAE